MNKRAVTVMLGALLIPGLLSAGGCGGASNSHIEPYEADSPGGYQETIPNGTGERPARMNGTAPGPSDGRVNGQDLARIAEQVPGVERAKVYMNGGEVIVGLRLNDTGARKQDVVEKQVQSALSWQYAEYDYYVTADKKLNEQIDTLLTSRAAGYKAQAAAADAQAIIQDIARTMTRP
jgi:Sporulation lipoprotein YhcN/YlaJ (Spore_YhcN_YlaJ).